MPTSSSTMTASKLRRARQAQGWSQEHLAAQLGTNALTIYRWEARRSFPSPYYRQRLRDIFGLSFEELGLLPPQPEEPLPADGASPLGHDAPPPVALPQRLVGREMMLHEVKSALLASPGTPVALYGLPGVGKTALAAMLAQDAEVRARFPDGVLWAGLGPTPSLIATLHLWGSALALAPAELRQHKDALALGSLIRSASGQRRILFVLDDAWQIADAHLVKVGGPHSGYVLTTRFPHIAHQFAHTGAIMVPELSAEAGIELLASLAPGMDEAYGGSLRAIAQAVGGLPLALTLIGHHLHLQASLGQPRRVEHALKQMRSAQDRLRLSEPRSPHEAPPHSTAAMTISLQASIALSMHALEASAQHLLGALAQFPAKPNSFSEEAAYAASSLDDLASFIAALDALLDAGLIESAAPERYMLHQTIADFARLTPTDAGIKMRLARHYAEYASLHADNIDSVAPDAANMAATFAALAPDEFTAPLLPGITRFATYLAHRGEYASARTVLMPVRDAACRLHLPGDAARASLELGWLALWQDDIAQAEAYARESLAWGEQCDDPVLLVSIYHLLGSIANRTGDFLAAEGVLNKGIALAQTHGDAAYHPLLLSLGKVHLLRGETAAAERCYREGLSLVQSNGKTADEDRFAQALGVIAAQRGDFLAARGYFTQALTAATQLGLLQEQVMMLANLGGLADEMGEFAEAQQHLDEGMRLARHYDFRERLCGLLSTAIHLAMQRDDMALAEAYAHEGLSIARALNSAHKIAVLLLYSGQVALQQDALAEAAAHLREGMRFAKARLPKLLAEYLNDWGELLVHRGQVHSALRVYQSAWQRASATELQGVQAAILFNQAQALLALGDVSAAQEYGQRSLRLFVERHHHWQHKVRQWLAVLDQGAPAEGGEMSTYPQ